MSYCTVSDLIEQISEEELIQLSDDRDSLASSTLSAEISTTATTIPLANAGTFPTSGRVQIGNEKITYTGKTDNQLTGCTRGANDTTPAIHAISAAVIELNRLDTSATDRAIADSDAEINSYCAACYASSLPFSPVPAIIRKMSVVIAIYNLFARRKGAPEDRKQRYDAAVKFLLNVSKGLISLGVDAPAQADDAGPVATTLKSDRIFTMGTSELSGTLDSY